MSGFVGVDPVVHERLAVGLKRGRRVGDYYGGLQFLTSTWLAYGGGDFASRADLASREQQITVANRVYADNGTSQWQCKA